MKILIVCLLCCWVSTSMAEDKTKLQKVSKKVEKRKGYCSPLDRLRKADHCSDENSDEKRVNKANKKLKGISKKVEKKKGYCSPLDKMTGAAHCKNKK